MDCRCLEFSVGVRCHLVVVSLEDHAASHFAKGPRTIHILRGGLGGQVQKMASFADVQYCSYADIVVGSEKVQNYSDVIYGRMVPDSKYIPTKVESLCGLQGLLNLRNTFTFHPQKFHIVYLLEGNRLQQKLFDQIKKILYSLEAR